MYYLCHHKFLKSSDVLRGHFFRPDGITRVGIALNLTNEKYSHLFSSLIFPFQIRKTDAKFYQQLLQFIQLFRNIDSI